jgi:predicted metalloprotease with PDZ domain
VLFKAARASQLQMGHFIMPTPAILLSEDTSEAASSSDFDGLIGAEFLSRFTVTYDYSRRQMFLDPNGLFGQAVPVDGSGVRLKARGADFRTFEISHIIQNSPASEAGLRVGDIIRAIDGRPASEFTREHIRSLFKQDGKECVLEVLRAKKRLQFTLKLRPLI